MKNIAWFGHRLVVEDATMCAAHCSERCRSLRSRLQPHAQRDHRHHLCCFRPGGDAERLTARSTSAVCPNQFHGLGFTAVRAHRPPGAAFCMDNLSFSHPSHQPYPLQCLFKGDRALPKLGQPRAASQPPQDGVRYAASSHPNTRVHLSLLPPSKLIRFREA